MVDVMDSRARSRLMTNVRGRGNRSTELRLVVLLRRLGIRGWRRQTRLIGTPDIVFRAIRIVVYADGCFWHGCPRHYTSPATRAAYWRKKVADNRARDQKLARRLRRQGWSVWRIWECRIRQDRLPRRLIRLIAAKTAGRSARESTPGRSDSITRKVLKRASRIQNRFEGRTQSASA